MSTATATQAEHFLAQHGIKFRVVASERGPGEWNVTFSRKGGGRIKLDFYQPHKPTVMQVLSEMVVGLPYRTDYTEEQDYIEDYRECGRVCHFFTHDQLRAILNLRGGN